MNIKVGKYHKILEEKDSEVFDAITKLCEYFSQKSIPIRHDSKYSNIRGSAVESTR